MKLHHHNNLQFLQRKGTAGVHQCPPPSPPSAIMHCVIIKLSDCDRLRNIWTTASVQSMHICQSLNTQQGFEVMGGGTQGTWPASVM